MLGNHQPANDDFDLGRLSGRLAAKWLRVLIVSVAAAGLALAFVKSATPHYKGETRLLIEIRGTSSNRPDGNAENDRPILNEEGVAGQLEVISSTGILKQVADKLDLSHLPEFDEAAEPSPVEKLLVAAGLSVDPDDIPAEERVLKAMRGKLNVHRVEKSRFIGIEFSSEDAKLAADIPNALAETFIAARRDATVQSNTDAIRWRGSEIKSEAALQRELLETAPRKESNYRPVEARVFSRATVPAEPYFPKALPIAGVAFAATLLVTAIMTLLGEMFGGRTTRPATGAKPEPITQVPMPDALASVEGGSDAAPPRSVAATAMEGSRRAIGVETAARRLIAGGSRRAIFISPEGDEAAATAVFVAREAAYAGLRVVLLDLTASGAASRHMLAARFHSGITNLLASEAQFSDVIHADRYSTCHVVPHGTADPERAMRAADRLPIIMNSLAAAYDVVVVECGPADAEGIGRLVSDGTEILVSVLEPNDPAIVETMADLAKSGYGRLTLVSPLGCQRLGFAVPDRSAA